MSCFLYNRTAATNWVRPFKKSSTKPDGMNFLKKTSGHGFFALNISSSGSMPHFWPEGSIHIIKAPTTAPIPINNVKNFRNFSFV